MHCELFEQRLEEQLDRRAGPHDDEALTAHARQCPACAALLASYSALFKGFEQLPAPRPSDNLAARVAAEVQSHGQSPQQAGAPLLRLPEGRRRRRRVSMLAAMAALAAALLLTVPLLWVLRQRDAGGPGNVPVARGTDGATTAELPAAESAPHIPGVEARERRRPFRALAAGLAHETRRSLSGAMLIVPGVRSADTQLAASELQPADGVDSSAESESLMKDLSPLTESTASALDSLLKILPAGDEDPTS